MWIHPEEQYLDLLQQCVNKFEDDPTPKADRTGTGTYGVFGRQIRFDLHDGFPLLTTKKLWMKGIVAELLWMLSGDTNNTTLTDQGVHIWDEWADQFGELGPIYGKQWRSWDAGFSYPIDQIAEVIDSLKNNPGSRRHLVSAWNPTDLPAMALSPCHCLFQFYVDDGKLSCQLYQRSADIFLGVPFNIASYALLTQMIAQECNLGLGEFIHTFGDLHLYSNHVEQAYEQLKREPLPFGKVFIEKKPIFDIKPEDIQLVGYESHPAIKGDVSK